MPGFNGAARAGRAVLQRSPRWLAVSGGSPAPLMAVPPRSRAGQCGGAMSGTVNYPADRMAADRLRELVLARAPDARVVWESLIIRRLSMSVSGGR